MRRELPVTGILQDWVVVLGLRQQGVLMAAVRGADTAPKNDPSKDFTRALRGMILNTHCADPADAVSFIEFCDSNEMGRRVDIFRKNLDHYPHHFVMHLIHTVEVIAYCHPDSETRFEWAGYYYKFCKGLHVNPESIEQMTERLDADEVDFGENKVANDG